MKQAPDEWMDFTGIIQQGFVHSEYNDTCETACFQAYWQTRKRPVQQLYGARVFLSAS